MKVSHKKFLQRLSIVGLCLTFSFLPLSTSFAEDENVVQHVLGERTFEKSVNVSSGALLKSEKYTTENVNQSVNVLEVNMSDPFTKLHLNINSPINRLTTTSYQSLLNNRVDHQVVGAVNASFNETGTGFGLPANLIAINNHIAHFGLLSPDESGPNFYRNAFGMTEDGKPLIDHYEPKMTFVHNNRSLPIYSINTQRFNNEVVLFTPNNRYNTVAQSASQWATEIVVTKASKNMKQLSFGDKVSGTVSEVRRFGEGANSIIPDDGFVLSANGGALAETLANVKVGDQITVDVQIDSKWQNASYMIGTGPMLVKDGKVNINMNLNSSFAKDRHPRTAVAYSKDRNKVFLVTIDGRQTGFSNGVSLQQFADYLISLGADRAINLDGGGSTTMLARNPGYGFPSLVNNPSQVSERGVASTLQVIDLTPPVKVKEKALVVDNMSNLSLWKTSSIRANAFVEERTGYGPARNGQPSIKFSYELLKEEAGTSAAYLVRPTPIKFDDRPKQIGAWVFGDGKGHWLRGVVYDGQGKQHYINFTGETGVTWTGWRFLRADVPEGVPLPISMERIYLAQTNNDKKSNGVIYLDQLEAIYDTSYHVDRFSDVKQGHWALSSIVALNDRNVINGMFDGSFKPSQPITREQAALMLVRELGIELDGRPDPGFADVTKDTPNYAVIAAVADEGLFSGKSGNQFKPKDTLTRAENAVILQRAYKIWGETDLKFSDVSKNHWAAFAIEALAANNITGGYPDGSFRPNNGITRAEFSVFMLRVIK